MSEVLLFNLIAAAIFSTLLFVILNYFHRWKIQNLQGLTVNYLTASAFAFFSNYEQNCKALSGIQVTGPPALGIGLLFILVFYTTALTTQKAGIAAASIASKMSMVLPITAGIYLYNDHLTSLRVIGIILAIVALYLSSKSTNSESELNKSKRAWIFPLLLFFGCGIIDTSIKISQQYIMNPENEQLYYSLLFGCAGLFGLIAMLYNRIKNKKIFELRSLFAGVLLGIVNYYSLLFLVRCLAEPGAESALIFALVNMLVVILSAITAFLVFKQKLTKENLSSIALALLAIFILSR